MAQPLNIFILDRDPKLNARYYVDKHVVKMILEHAQMLSTAVRLSGLDCGYKATHANHPCNLWTRESLDNWLYLRMLTYWIHKEWRYRFRHKKVHKSWQVILGLPHPQIPSIGRTPFAQAMPEQYRVKGNAVKAYRRYYRGEKGHIAEWTRRPSPDWF